MKKFSILGCGMLFVLCWYGWLVPTAWHVDDNAIFGESRKAASHLGAGLLGIIPLGLAAAFGWFVRITK